MEKQKEKEENFICPECDSECYYNEVRNIWCCDGCGKEWEKDELVLEEKK